MADGRADLTEAAIAYMNDLLARDPAAVASLITNRVPCNKQLAVHPTCQVWQVDPNSWTVGILGVINGLLGEAGCDLLCVVTDATDQHSIIRFQKYHSDQAGVSSSTPVEERGQPATEDRPAGKGDQQPKRRRGRPKKTDR